MIQRNEHFLNADGDNRLVLWLVYDMQAPQTVQFIQILRVHEWLDLFQGLRYPNRISTPPLHIHMQTQKKLSLSLWVTTEHNEKNRSVSDAGN